MNNTPVRGVCPVGRRWRIRLWLAAVGAVLGLGPWQPAARAEPPVAIGPPAYAQRIMDGKDEPAPEITQIGCKSCGSMPAPMLTQPIGGAGAAPCGNGCPTGNCKPGRKCPECCGKGGDSCGRFGQLCANLYECICCPDPCYDPVWLPEANSAFFVDHARPRTHACFRYDAGRNLVLPDRNEYFWARTGGKGPPNTERSVNYDVVSLYNETAAGAAAFFIEMPYWVLDPEVNGYDAGWGDLNLGTKTMFLDCELMQLTFQFRTYIPVGSSTKGFGTGHVTLEPSLLATVKVTDRTYVEAQISEWIPIGGDNDLAGVLLHYHTSINHSLCKYGCTQIIGSLEFSGWTFQDGALTNPDGTISRSSRETYFAAGPGIRFVVCEYLDFGFGAQFALTSDHWADQLYRTEFRLRF